jgi:ankyrin repeat protein
MIAGILHANFTPLHMAALLGLDHVIVPRIQHEPETFLCKDWGTSPAECLLLGVPIFFSDADYTTNPDTPDTYEPKLMVALWRDWMGGGTSPKVWAQLVQSLATVAPMADLGVNIGARRYTAVDLLCRRATTEDIAVLMKVFLELVRSGVKFDHRSIDCLFDTCVTSARRSTSDFNELAPLIITLNELSSTVDPPCQDDDTLSYMRGATHKLTSACEISVPTMISTAKLPDRHYDAALWAAVKYCNLSRLHELSLDPRFKTFHERSLPGRSLIHVAAMENALSAVEFLLTHGVNQSIQDKRGRTALHIASDRFAHVLLKHGASDAARDNDGNTAWHCAAENDDGTIRTLLETCSDIGTRLRELNIKGQTPMAIALASAQHKNALLLLSHCQSAECFVGNLPPYHTAMRAGFDDIIEELIASKIPMQGGSPLLSAVTPASSAKSIRLLKSLCGDACDQLDENCLPMERLLQQLPGQNAPVDRDLLSEVMPSHDFLKARCLVYFCDEVIPSVGHYQHDAFHEWLVDVLEVFLGQRVFSAYETTGFHANGTTKPLPGYDPLAMALLNLVSDFDLEWENMTSLDSCILRVLEASGRKWDDLVLLPLLCISVYANWESVVRAVLDSANEIGVHDLLDGLSCLEFACQPGNQCSPATFETLLSKADVSKLNQPNIRSGYCLLHLLAEPGVAWRAEKLQLLLKTGADPNVRDADSRPAILEHAWRSSIDSVKTLIKYGADPEAASDVGWNTMLAFVWWDEPDGLKMLQETHSGIDWGKTICAQPTFWTDEGLPRLVKESDIANCNALHIAALGGSPRCLRYLVEEGLSLDLNARTGIGYTCVHLMLESEKRTFHKMLMYLHTKSCNFNALSDLEETPYDLAVRLDLPHFTTQGLLRVGGKSANVAELLSDRHGNAQPGNSFVLSERNGNRPYIAMSNDKAVRRLKLQRLEQAITAGDVSACSRLRSHGCPIDVPLPESNNIPIIAALSREKPDVVMWLLENGGGEWGTSCEDAREGVIQYALRFQSCNIVLEALLIHFESLWPEWIIGEWRAVNAALYWENIDGLRIVLDFIRNSTGRKRYGGSPAACALPS